MSVTTLSHAASLRVALQANASSEAPGEGPEPRSTWVSRWRSRDSRAVSCAACGLTVEGRRCGECRQGVYIPSRCPGCGDGLRGSRDCSDCGALAGS
ncbi:hypothetical protein LQ327_32755 [Actinomycetospora endophytica]|uniref:Double zinc ribbon protein n=1 Tax=Actinomycetospora endophytica TaxID=2291215 RepID=A0ABS8PIP7_9PSEU|nr:hypothetical protein [Actinomycetospora endophytica]MCD2198151.1 hypothetical protein [Actinomycetospora endophytica]